MKINKSKNPKNFLKNIIYKNTINKKQYKKIENTSIKINIKENKYSNIIINAFIIISSLSVLIIISYVLYDYIRFLQNSLIINKAIKKNIFKTDKKFNVCLCAIGKKENLYVPEYIEHYKSIGVEQFFLGDNNDLNDEKFSDVINSEIVHVTDLKGLKIEQSFFYNEIFNTYNKYCNWMAFVDFDELIIMKNNKKISDYLTENKFDKCDSIRLNWVTYYDNNLVRYDNRTMKERFTNDKNSNINLMCKSIVNGKLGKNVWRPMFYKFSTAHRPGVRNIACDSDGNKLKDYKIYTTPKPVINNMFLAHYSTKTAEEFAIKVKRMVPFMTKINKEEWYISKINSFFSKNKFTEEKYKILCNALNMTFDSIEKKFLNSSTNKNN